MADKWGWKLPETRVFEVRPEAVRVKRKKWVVRHGSCTLCRRKEGKCPAGKCKALLSFRIDPQLCVGCTLCSRNCPVDAIIGERKEAHFIDTTKCIKCGTCKDKCKFNAISAG